MANIDELRRVLFVEKLTLICYSSGEFIDFDAKKAIEESCIVFDEIGYGSVDSVCVDDISFRFRAICGSPRLLGTSWLVDGKPKDVTEGKLLRALEKVYKIKMEMVERRKLADSLSKIRTSFRNGKCELKERAPGEDLLQLFNYFITDMSLKDNEFAHNILMYGENSEQLRNFKDWLIKNCE